MKKKFDHVYIKFKFFLYIFCVLSFSNFLLAKGTAQDSNALCEAIKSNNKIKVVQALQTGADINGQNSNGFLPLYYARNPDMISFLLDRGAAINNIDAFGKTRLYHAVFDNNIPITNFLIEHGADPNIPDKHGQQPIGCACYFSYHAMVENLITHSIIDNNRTNFFYYAVSRKTSDALEKLIMRGLDFRKFLKFRKATMLSDDYPYRELLIEAEESLLNYARPTLFSITIQTIFNSHNYNGYQTVKTIAEKLGIPTLLAEFNEDERWKNSTTDYKKFIATHRFLRNFIEKK